MTNTTKHMKDCTMAENRATVVYCSMTPGWPKPAGFNYERQDAELERIRRDRRLEDAEMAQINRQLGRLR